MQLDVILERMGLQKLSPEDARQKFPGSSNNVTSLSVADLIRLGAVWEDQLSDLQALRHFYDPVNDRALDVPVFGTGKSVRSPDWALEDKTSFPGPIATQLFSLHDAYDYLYSALTFVNPRSVADSTNERKRYFGLTFQSLGHVIHHLQDMAQPQHVRNDPHCDSVALCKSLANVTGDNLFYAPSTYEKYTNSDVSGDPLLRIRANLPYLGPGSEPVYPAINGSDAPNSARQFWRTTAAGSNISAGKGIAEYTNYNFFSDGSIYRYDAPILPEISLPSERVDVAQLLPGAGLSGEVWFFRSTVTDNRSPSPQSENPRAASSSLFDPDLAARISSAQAPHLYFALNRFTFDAAHKFLIPRAVGYSAGLINFFFRGQLEIGPPDEGVYGIVDHTVENQPDVDGFGKLKVKVRNVTSGRSGTDGRPIIEPIPNDSSGTLLAIVKFHRNNCYKPDLSGEYGAPNIEWSTCRASGEEIVVSSPQPVPNGINDADQTVTFLFPNKVPINATDVLLQIVYRGPLGEEADAVIVATRNIAEPLFLTQYSRWDQYMYSAFPRVEPGPYTFAQWCAQGFSSYDACRDANGLTLKVRFAQSPGYSPDPRYPEGEWQPIASEPPLAPIAAMTAPVGTYARIALLADGVPAPGVFVYEWIDPAYSSLFKWESVSLVGNRNQLDPDSGTLVPMITYVPGRGIYVPTAEGPLLNGGTAPVIAPLVPTATQIYF